MTQLDFKTLSIGLAALVVVGGGVYALSNRKTPEDRMGAFAGQQPTVYGGTRRKNNKNNRSKRR